MTQSTRALITARCFPTPALILRTNDPATQRHLRTFAHAQAEAARSLLDTLTDALRQTHDGAARVAAFTATFGAAEDWRYWLAVTTPEPTGRYGPEHVDRFRTPITDDNPNLFRLGEHPRFRDGTAWNSITRTTERRHVPHHHRRRPDLHRQRTGLRPQGKSCTAPWTCSPGSTSAPLPR